MFLRSLILLSLPLSHSIAQAKTLDVRGVVMDITGKPQPGSCLLRFKLFGVSPNAPEAWSESIYIHNQGGEFHAVLGTVKPIPDPLFTDGYRLMIEPPAATGWRAAATSVNVTKEASSQQTIIHASSATGTPAPETGTSAKRGSIPGGEGRRQSVSAPKEPEKPRALHAKSSEKRGAAVKKGRPSEYIAMEGDTLVSVASKVLGEPARWTELYDANAASLPRGGDLRRGQRLLMPASALPHTRGVYTVEKGDTLPSLAAKLWGNPTRWTELYETNAASISRGGDLRPGQRLVVPGME